MPLQWVIERDEDHVGWRHGGSGQAIDLTPEEARTAAMIDQAEGLRRVADGLFAIAEAIKDASMVMKPKD